MITDSNQAWHAKMTGCGVQEGSQQGNIQFFGSVWDPQRRG